jgi:hypothetical protein
VKEITSPSNLEVVKPLPQEALVSLNNPVPTLRRTMDWTIALNKYLRLILMKLRKKLKQRWSTIPLISSYKTNNQSLTSNN